MPFVPAPSASAWAVRKPEVTLKLWSVLTCASRPHLYRNLHFSVLDLTKQRLLTPCAFWEAT